MKAIKNRKNRLLILPALLLLLAAAFFLYVSDYYRAEPEALAALESDAGVTVSAVERGWLFDGPSEEAALIFYPGAKVEETAYAPLLHRLAAEEMDVFLVKMPFRLAFFGIDRAEELISSYEYANWYLGGHSLGGAMAARYASLHGEALRGVILFAAYPTAPLEKDLISLELHGSEDRVLNLEKLREGAQYAPARSFEHVLEGGNHAQFGNYGEQRGDGSASLSPEAQQAETVAVIARVLRENQA